MDLTRRLCDSVLCDEPVFTEVGFAGAGLGVYLCLFHMDRVMHGLSLEVPVEEGRAGYRKWRAEAGLPEPVRWPERELTP